MIDVVISFHFSPYNQLPWTIESSLWHFSHWTPPFYCHGHLCCFCQTLISSSSNSSNSFQNTPCFCSPPCQYICPSAGIFLLKHSFAHVILLLKIKPNSFCLSLRTLYLLNLIFHYLFIQPAILKYLLFS